MIRPATPADAPALARLLAELGYPDAGDQLADRLAALASRPRSRVLVAQADGEVLGLLTLEVVPVLHEPGDWCRVTALVVADAARGRGIGRALLHGAEAEAVTAGCSRIEATSARRRDGAHAFYRSRGYASTSEHFLKRLDG